MLKSNFFRPRNFNIFYDLRFEKDSESPLCAPTSLRKFPLATSKISLSESNFFISAKNPPLFWVKKEEKPQCLRALSSSLCKYTKFSAEKQIVLTFRNNYPNVKMQRFAQDRFGLVLYYEERSGLALLVSGGDSDGPLCGQPAAETAIVEYILII